MEMCIVDSFVCLSNRSSPMVLNGNVMVVLYLSKVSLADNEYPSPVLGQSSRAPCIKDDQITHIWFSFLTLPIKYSWSTRILRKTVVDPGLWPSCERAQISISIQRM